MTEGGGVALTGVIPLPIGEHRDGIRQDKVLWQQVGKSPRIDGGIVATADVERVEVAGQGLPVATAARHGEWLPGRWKLAAYRLPL